MNIQVTTGKSENQTAMAQQDDWANAGATSFMAQALPCEAASYSLLMSLTLWERHMPSSQEVLDGWYTLRASQPLFMQHTAG